MKKLHIFLFLSCLAAILSLFYLKQKQPSCKDPVKKAYPVYKSGPSGALEALRFYSEVRAFPASDIPDAAFMKAFDYSRQHLSRAEFAIESTASTSWTSIGPNNIGGRSLCLAVHPVDTNVLFMGSASGGLWKSTTGGIGAQAWTYVETGYPSLAISSIAIDHSNPDIIYIGTGENYGYQYSENGLVVRVTRGVYGIGILKSTDGGVSWTKALDWSQNNKRGVWKIIIDPANSSILYTATSEGVYKSTNAGTDWSLVLNTKMVIDLEINQQNPSILYASAGNLTNNVPLANVGIYKTSDAGSSWTKLAGGLPSTWSGKATLEIYKSNPDTIFASIAKDFSYIGYYRSTNGGATWTQLNTSLPTGNQGWFNNVHLVKPDNSSLILVGQIDVYKSLNGGGSFSKKSDWNSWYSGNTPVGDPEGPSNFVHADVHDIVYNPKNYNKVYVITDGGLYRSNNFGDTYYSCNGGYVTTQFYNGFVNFEGDSLLCIGGLQDNRAAVYQGTTNWLKTYKGDGTWCGMDKRNKNVWYCAYVYGAIDRSDNAGLNWSVAKPPQNSSTNAFISPFIVSTYNPDYVFAAGTSFYRSTNRGGNWSSAYGQTQFSGRKALSMAASRTSVDTLYCGLAPGSSKAAGIVMSKDGGLTWTEITGTSLPNQFPTDIMLNPSNAAELYVTYGGYGNSHVFTSKNAGATWTDITSNLPDIPHFSVAVDPLYPNHIYVGNELGVYLSTDGGQNWMEFRSGMPYAIVFDLKVVDGNRHIRAVTHGHGVYERALAKPGVTTFIGTRKSKQTEPAVTNFPNPFSKATTLIYTIPVKGKVIINLFNYEGKLVRKLAEGEHQPGQYKISLERDDLSAGIYFYRFETAGKISSGKLIITD